MNKARLEAFSDGVFAIIITIMVLELKIPDGPNWSDLKPLAPTLYCYLISFAFVGVYWANHHHLLHTVKQVNAGIIWANMHLLFWLSLVPVATGWMGKNCFHPNTVALYGALLSLCGAAFTILSHNIRRTQKHETALMLAIDKSKPKSIASLALYLISIPVAFLQPFLSEAIFLFVACMWIIPSKAIETALEHEA